MHRHNGLLADIVVQNIVNHSSADYMICCTLISSFKQLVFVQIRLRVSVRISFQVLSSR